VPPGTEHPMAALESGWPVR